jgi:DNA-binding transcriptional regulator GbsR (MarR family)
MEESERIKKQKELIELIGRQNEKEGFQPVAARIMGLLMVMDKEEFTFEEIVDEMRISKSSVSTALKNLEIRGMIEYVTYPGDRKRYFRAISGEIDTMINEMETKLIKNMEVINKILELKKDSNSRSATFLKNIAIGMDFFIHKLNELKIEFKKGQ